MYSDEHYGKIQTKDQEVSNGPDPQKTFSGFSKQLYLQVVCIHAVKVKTFTFFLPVCYKYKILQKRIQVYWPTEFTNKISFQSEVCWK